MRLSFLGESVFFSPLAPCPSPCLSLRPAPCPFPVSSRSPAPSSLPAGASLPLSAFALPRAPLRPRQPVDTAFPSRTRCALRAAPACVGTASTPWFLLAPTSPPTTSSEVVDALVPHRPPLLRSHLAVAASPSPAREHAPPSPQLHLLPSRRHPFAQSRAPPRPLPLCEETPTTAHVFLSTPEPRPLPSPRRMRPSRSGYKGRPAVFRSPLLPKPSNRPHSPPATPENPQKRPIEASSSPAPSPSSLGSATP